MENTNQLDLLSFREKTYPRQSMTDDQQVILDLIEPRTGKANALPVAAITRATKIPDRRARDIVKSLVEEHRIPIGSCTGGFFMAVTEQEIQEVYHTLVSWGLSVLKRACAFKKSSNLDEIVGQLRLELQPSASQ